MNEKQMDNLISLLRDIIMALLVFIVLLIIGFVFTIAGIYDLMSTLEEVAR